jgi:Uncharacterized protein conserved in bacteria
MVSTIPGIFLGRGKVERSKQRPYGKPDSRVIGETMTRIVSKEESGISLSARGDWFHHGEPVLHPRVIQLFHRAIRRDDEGRYYLYNVVGALEENVYFEVEDTAFFVLRLEFDEATKSFTVCLNNEDKETLDVKTLREDERGVMYCRTQDGDRARFSQSALMSLSDFVKTEGDLIYIDATGEKVIISKM